VAPTAPERQRPCWRQPTDTLAGVCLLLFAWQPERSYPLTVAANRDERFDRSASSFCVVREHHPRVLGGLDHVGGGTWLATNEHGVVAGLTNRPSPGGRDPAKRTRGELPLVLAGHHTAAAGVETLVRRIRPADYNPAWLLVGDRQSLFSITVLPDEPICVRQLGPGVHVLENAPLGQPSVKVDHVNSLVAEASSQGRSLWSVLPSVLSDHTVPGVTGPDAFPDEEAVGRPHATLAACVHTEEFGTRSATLVRVPSAAGAHPEMLVADGPPCTATFVDVTRRWMS
jgi:uncharacterized protein with NRDE domain